MLFLSSSYAAIHEKLSAFPLLSCWLITHALLALPLAGRTDNFGILVRSHFRKNAEAKKAEKAASAPKSAPTTPQLTATATATAAGSNNSAPRPRTSSFDAFNLLKRFSPATSKSSPLASDSSSDKTASADDE